MKGFVVSGKRYTFAKDGAHDDNRYCMDTGNTTRGVPGESAQGIPRGANTQIDDMWEDLDEFIRVAATDTAASWLTDALGPVGVMITGNFGRPGGGCIDDNNKFVFKQSAKT